MNAHITPACVAVARTKIDVEFLGESESKGEE